MDPTVLLQEPLDIVRVSLDDRVTIKCRGDREVMGKLHAYDMHLNMVLGDVEEVATTVTTDPLTGDEQTKKTTRRLPLIFLRGDAIILVAPRLHPSARLAIPEWRRKQENVPIVQAASLPAC